MPTTTILRDYQREAIADIEVRRLAGDTRVPIVLATGLGKTQIFTAYADHWLNQPENAGQRVLILAHTDELIGQAAKRMRQVAPHRRVGIVKAGQNETLAEIIVSSVQTMRSERRREQIKRVGLIIIDECHHAVKTNTYGKILDHFNAFGSVYLDERTPAPAPFTLGVTATLARSDKSKLSSVWQDCTFTRDILFGIRNGYLLDVRGERIIVPDLDMSNVRVRAGDYSDTDIADELERTFAPELIAKEYRRLANERRGIAFWPLVETAYHGAKAFEDVGIRSGVVHGQLPKPERRELLQRFHLPLTHAEAIDVMHNAMVLTEGFDEPTADVVVIARPTRSAPLFQQMVGRVLRPNLELPPAERGKALLLDVTGAGEQNNLRSLIDLSPEKRHPAGDDEIGDRSLLEWDEYLDEIQEEIDEQRAGATTYFESDTYAGPVETKSFDPLGRAHVWGATPAGHHYINTGSGYVFLAPSLAADAEPNTYDVVTCSARATPYKDKRTEEVIIPFVRGTQHTALDFELALGWGEEVAIEMGGYGAKTLTGRKSAWRKAPPSPAAVTQARRMGIDPEGKNGGELSEELDAKFAAWRIDPLVEMTKRVIAQQRAAQTGQA